MPVEFEELMATIVAMSRDEISDRLLNFKSDFPMDFTRDYLDRLPLDRLGHILLAARLYRARKERKASA